MVTWPITYGCRAHCIRLQVCIYPGALGAEQLFGCLMRDTRETEAEPHDPVQQATKAGTNPYPTPNLKPTLTPTLTLAPTLTQPQPQPQP